MQTDETIAKLERAYFSDEMHEKSVIDTLPQLLEGKKLFVDAGASLGQYTYHANRIMRGGAIVAIEADPVRFERLKSNCEDWSSTSSNTIECLNAAVDRRAGRASFYTTDSDVSGALFEHDMPHLSETEASRVEYRRIDVEAVRLDDVLGDRVPDLVKMDIEGAELRALQGSRLLLDSPSVLWLLEVHDFADPQGQRCADDVLDFLSSHGLEGRRLHGKMLFGRDLRASQPTIWRSTSIQTLGYRLKNRAKRRFPVLARLLRIVRKRVGRW